MTDQTTGNEASMSRYQNISTVELVNDRALLGAAVQILGLILFEDSDVIECFSTLNTKQYQYQDLIDARLKDMSNG